MDIATKNNRAILGINIQYIVDKRIVLRTLAMIRLKESHTAVHLVEVVLGILAEFGIALDQLFSVTTDNAGYMLLSSEILDEIAEEDSDGTEYAEMSEEQIDEEFYRQLLKDTEQEFLHYTTPEHVKSIPCGAHRFQLAIQDAFAESSKADNLIGKIRGVMKKLRTPNLCNALNEQNMKKPFLDNKRRWNGKYFMVKRCLELREFVDMMAVTDKTFKITDAEWLDLEELRDVLHDCAEFTKTIQGVQITLSDFYAEWVQLKLKLQPKQRIKFVDNLIKHMGKRGNDLLTDPLVLASLFLDMRYRVLLNTKPIQKQLAMNQLTLLWKRVCSLRPENQQVENTSEATSDTGGTENDSNVMDSYLDSLESSSYQPSTNTASEDIMFKLQQYNVEAEQKKREPKTRHPMDFWYENRHTMPELYELAKLVFAVCPTETSVERNFSGLSYVLNRYRGNLTDKNLETIMFVRLNKELFDRVIIKLQ
ncbi:uncharacterized protein LOC129571873 [Sitodiplosis mosellana]|uniref:uncharacterized protein LOC129571873 n=1 Tax=Sitodiplosis mosellana TaxID=263140 RepID=UPI002444EDAE|nr:uncharacterized protein LOC129571873 [Sitodiplosis mosellana]